MNLEDLVNRLDPQWRSAFVKFVETGDADQAFLKYLDEDKGCQKAVELAFTAQAAAFEDFARALKHEQSVPLDKIPMERRKATVSATMANCLEGVLDLPPGERREVFERAASTLTASIGSEQRKALTQAVEDLKVTVAQVESTV